MQTKMQHHFPEELKSHLHGRGNVRTRKMGRDVFVIRFSVTELCMVRLAAHSFCMAQETARVTRV